MKAGRQCVAAGDRALELLVLGQLIRKSQIPQLGFFFIIIIILFYFLTLQYCIGFAIYQHEYTTAVDQSPSCV